MSPIEGRAILTAAETRAAETAAGVPPETLMARAGRGVAAALRRLSAGAETLVLCGPGNNGGDGYVAATQLAAWGLPVRVAALGEPRSNPARQARAAWTGPVEPIGRAMPAPMLVDALFGAGLSRPLDDAVATDFRRLASAARLVVAIDLPSGIASDDGAVPTAPPRVHLTLATGSVKPAHLLQPAARHCGTVRLIDIGLEDEGITRVITPPALPPPGPDAHKYTRGMVAVVPGAMAGAGALAAVSALRAGAGYVLLLAEAGDEPHALVRRRFSPDALAEPRIGAVVIGPGLGRDEAARERLGAALAGGRPLVIDGDALRLIEPDAPRQHPAPVVLTPHAGEFAAVFGDAGGDKIARTRAAAARSGAVVVHKGADTVVAAPDGRVAMAGEANAWLSTAGTGDVLAGTVGAMLAGGGDAFAAAAAAVWLHGDAARRAGRAFLADDLAAMLTPARAAL